jgi:hypothetical protein
VSDVGSVAELWRFPVKSMLGERLDRVDLTERGVFGDRAYALVDVDTGKVASAKSGRLFPDLLRCRAAFLEAPQLGRDLAAGADHVVRRCLGHERLRRR